MGRFRWSADRTLRHQTKMPTSTRVDVWIALITIPMKNKNWNRKSANNIDRVEAAGENWLNKGNSWWFFVIAHGGMVGVTLDMRGIWAPNRHGLRFRRTVWHNQHHIDRTYIIIIQCHLHSTCSAAISRRRYSNRAMPNNQSIFAFKIAKKQQELTPPALDLKRYAFNLTK